MPRFNKGDLASYIQELHSRAPGGDTDGKRRLDLLPLLNLMRDVSGAETLAECCW
jgi:hypothetical protein